jgi:hypothetical protein
MPVYKIKIMARGMFLFTTKIGKTINLVRLSVALKLSVTHRSGKENFSQSKQAILV